MEGYCKEEKQLLTGLYREFFKFLCMIVYMGYSEVVGEGEVKVKFVYKLYLLR